MTVVDAVVSEVIGADAVSARMADDFAARTGFDPRQSTYPYFRLVPQRVQSWREVNGLTERDLMREGQWLA